MARYVIVNFEYDISICKRENTGDHIQGMDKPRVNLTLLCICISHIPPISPTIFLAYKIKIHIPILKLRKSLLDNLSIVSLYLDGQPCHPHVSMNHGHSVTYLLFKTITAQATAATQKEMLGL
jgi:hypothetical protein